MEPAVGNDDDESTGQQAKPAGRKTAKPEGDAAVVALLLKAARRLVKTHGDLDGALDALNEQRREWARKVKAAKNEMGRALSESTVDSGDTADEQTAVTAILAANVLREQAKISRASWADKEVAAREEIAQLIEGTAPGKSVVLGRLAHAHQELQEAEAGRKQALHLLLLDVEELQAKARKQMDGARQLALFD
jgi:hypothetical protein